MGAIRKSVTKSITAENVFTDLIQVDKGDTGSISVSGTFVATVTLQRRLDGANWRDIESYTAQTEKDFEVGEGSEIRLGVKTGDYTSGTVEARLGI
ncbi:hypothetical protein LCGC14_1920400 [marine sediment metagenome]|uniref:Uncharacterized protein n=1 Tax=marine sediment metagenome TaxID=412755 RepID=A0A0F9FRS5_9ZZZZ